MRTHWRISNNRLGVLLLGGAIATALVIVLVQHSFSSAPCAASQGIPPGEANSGPPPAGATAWAKLDPTQQADWIARFPTLEYQWGLTPQPTMVWVGPGATAAAAKGLSPAEAYHTPDLTGLTEVTGWADVQPPQPYGVGGIAGAPVLPVQHGQRC